MQQRVLQPFSTVALEPVIQESAIGYEEPMRNATFF